jgi:hypothetical protein
MAQQHRFVQLQIETFSTSSYIGGVGIVRACWKVGKTQPLKANKQEKKKIFSTLFST